MERGARIAETGTLVRSRAGSGTSASVVASTVTEHAAGAFVPSLHETAE